MKTLVIYHRADFDGIFSREIAKLHFGDRAEYLGWDYGDIIPEVDPETALYMIDISVDGLMGHPNLVWIDHHKSAIKKYSKAIAGYRIDGVAACRLAWQWFREQGQGGPLVLSNDLHKPRLEDYRDRHVIEPISVRLAGEYDIWDKRDPRADLFQHGLRSQELHDFTWRQLLSLTHSETITNDLLKKGEVLAYAKNEENASIIRNAGFTFEFEGLTFLACNHARYNSLLFEAAIEDKHDGLFGFSYDGHGKWRVSLYGVPNKPEIDLSVIAVKHGGGGHRQACGFKCDGLTFLPQQG